MAKLKCRVCGKEYNPCYSRQAVKGVFRWQDVTCSPECGEEYLKRILESRNPNKSGISEPEAVDTAHSTASPIADKKSKKVHFPIVTNLDSVPSPEFAEVGSVSTTEDEGETIYTGAHDEPGTVIEDVE